MKDKKTSMSMVVFILVGSDIHGHEENIYVTNSKEAAEARMKELQEDAVSEETGISTYKYYIEEHTMDIYTLKGGN